MAIKYFQSEIIAIVDESPIVKRFFFRPETPLKFTPGQFVMLNLPIEDKYTNRSYSIASEPLDDGTFELVIVLKEDGKGTPYMWANFKVGTQVPVAGPLGKYVLHEPILDPLCLIGTGTGIAPLRSMIRHIIRRNIPHGDIHLVFGNRKEEDILYRSEFEQLAAENDWFHFYPVLSRSSMEWTGRKGYVHGVYQELFQFPDPVTFYICGWSNMVREARDFLKNNGYEKARVKYELYD